MSVRNQPLRYFLWFFVLGATTWLYEMQGWLVEAGTTTGTAVDIGGLNDFAKTVETYAKGNIGKMVGIVMGIGGLGMALTGRLGTGVGVLGSGLGVAFVPNIMSTVFDSTAAATWVPVAAGMQPTVLSTLLATLGQSIAGQAFLAALYPVAVFLKWMRDPVMWGAATVIVASRVFWAPVTKRLWGHLYVG